MRFDPALTALRSLPMLGTSGLPPEGAANLPKPTAPQNLTVATTGASGSLFLEHFLLAVERDARVQTVNFIASDSALARAG